MGGVHRLVMLNSRVCEALRGYLLVRPADAGEDLVLQRKTRRRTGPRSIEDPVGGYLAAPASGAHRCSSYEARSQSTNSGSGRTKISRKILTSVVGPTPATSGMLQWRWRALTDRSVT